jgi:hypothetical protein
MLFMIIQRWLVAEAQRESASNTIFSLKSPVHLPKRKKVA